MGERTGQGPWRCYVSWKIEREIKREWESEIEKKTKRGRKFK